MWLSMMSVRLIFRLNTLKKLPLTKIYSNLLIVRSE